MRKRCPFAVKALKYSDKLTGAPFRLNCAECPRGRKCDSWEAGDGYKYSGKPLFKMDWQKCPTAYLNDTQLSISLNAISHGRIHPLTGWPFEYSAWFVEWVTALHNAIEERKAEEVSSGSW